MQRIIVAAILALLGCSPAFAQTYLNPTSGSIVDLPTTNSSVAITTGNTFQTVIAAISTNNQRKSLTIQNNNASDSCWLFIGAGSATKATAILLASGQAYTRYYPYVPSDAIQATCTTTADTLYVDVQ